MKLKGWRKEFIMWRRDVSAAAHAAAKDGTAFDSIERVIAYDKRYGLAVDAIYHFEKARRERSIFRFLYRYLDR